MIETKSWFSLFIRKANTLRRIGGSIYHGQGALFIECCAVFESVSSPSQSAIPTGLLSKTGAIKTPKKIDSALPFHHDKPSDCSIFVFGFISDLFLRIRDCCRSTKPGRLS
jgi:hypothetical protein